MGFIVKPKIDEFLNKEVIHIQDRDLCCNRREFPTTFIELIAMAASARTGCIHPIMATGIITTL